MMMVEGEEGWRRERQQEAAKGGRVVVWCASEPGLKGKGGGLKAIVLTVEWGKRPELGWVPDDAKGR